eukprot:3386711-Lingulodinium_polyedra.AAC.1
MGSVPKTLRDGASGTTESADPTLGDIIGPAAGFSPMCLGAKAGAEPCEVDRRLADRTTIHEGLRQLGVSS